MALHGSHSLASSCSTATHLFATGVVLRWVSVWILRNAWLHDRGRGRLLVADLREIEPLLCLGGIESGAGHRHQRRAASGDARIDGVTVLRDWRLVVPFEPRAGVAVQRQELIVQPVAPPVGTLGDE